MGYNAPEEIIGKSMYDHTHVDNHEIVRERAGARQRREKVPSRYEITLIRRDGHEFLTEVHVSYIEYEGKPCSLSYVRDITDRKQHETRLQVLHLFTAQMASSVDLDEIERITYTALSQVLGLNRGSLGFVYDDVLCHQYRWNMNSSDMYDMPLDGPGITVRAVNTGETQLVGDVLVDPDYIMGGEYEMATRSELVAPIKIGDRIIGVINLENKEINSFSSYDVKIVEILAIHIGIALERMEYLTELARVRQNKDRELIESFKRFSNMIRHDLKGPLATITNAAYLIEQRPQLLDRPLSLIKTCVEVLDSILEDWSQKIYSQSIHRKDTSISGLIQDALQSIIIPEDVNVKRDVPVELTFNIDSLAILRVLINLVKNAVEAMPDGGTISIEAKTEDFLLLMSVSDEGIGIDPESVGKIFSPFYTNKEIGTGLGLAYCKQAVEAHGGNISFESNGKGTVFTVMIPKQV